MRVSRPKTGILLSFICLFILGAMPVITNSRPADSNALEFALALSFWQLIFALPLFLYELHSGARRMVSAGSGKRPQLRTFVVGITTGIMFGLSTWFYVLSMEQAGAISASIAIQSYPLFAVLTEFILLRQRKSLQETAVTLVLVVALYYLGTQGSWQIMGMSGWFFVALSVPLLWSIAHVLIRQELMHSPVTPAQVTFFRVLISTIFLGMVLALTGSSFAILLDPVILPFAMVMGFFYYMELIVWFYAMQHIDVSLASAVTTPWPAVTMGLSVIFLGEHLKSYQIYTFCIVAACIYALLALAIKGGTQNVESDL
ncbi:DMT family transporter [uncultured Desulfuromusa sp.]|uniref:DMT family transporter n=1 Tax=uncultured Desulfuromusa sp. TaxID=219183 RepID=UPI002AA7E225|nr:DMT family transporter [uncultured Desulfuromusa sp.]